MDRLVMASIVLAFAAFWTAHVALAVGIGRRGPWWRGLVACVALPLAPYWGFLHGLRVRAIVWGVALVVYVAAYALGRAP